MFRNKDVNGLLPWYLNDTLPPAERRVVDAWLRQNPAGQAELEAWQEVRRAIVGQPRQFPPAPVRQRVLAQVRATAAPRCQTIGLPQLAWGLALTLAVLVLLWIIVQPGIVLQWSVADGPPVAFRVYRAPVGSADFGLVEELPAGADVQHYSYVDIRLLPGESYVYRVEAVGPGGQVAASQTVTANTLEALPGQLAILLTSLIVGYGAVVVAQRGWGDGWRSQVSRRPLI